LAAIARAGRFDGSFAERDPDELPRAKVCMQQNKESSEPKANHNISSRLAQ